VSKKSPFLPNLHLWFSACDGLIPDKLTVFDLSGFQIFLAVELHFYLDPIFAANPENFFLQRIGDTTVIFEILDQFPGFIDKKVKLLPTFIAAHIQEKAV
jgi:hypothetical protein